MKKLLFLAALCGALLACSSKDEPEQTEKVTFTISNFDPTQHPLSAPKKAPAALYDGDDVLTDLYLFDGATQLVHQSSTQEDFGTITVMLTTGEHQLHFVATRSSELSVSNGVLACTSLRNTFGKTLNFTVNGSSEEQLVLDRLSGKLLITINDAIPAGASNLRIQLGQRYTSLNVQTLYGVNPAAAEFNLNISDKIGNTGYNINLWMLSPAADGYETSFSLTATNASSTIIGQAQGTLTIKPNTKTFLSGNLFAGTKSFISLNTSWDAEINESF